MASPDALFVIHIKLRGQAPKLIENDLRILGRPEALIVAPSKSADQQQLRAFADKTEAVQRGRGAVFIRPA